MRIGAKKRPFYRVVVVEERSKRTGGYVELLGTYNPLSEPKEIKLKQDRIDYWTKMGAQPSVGFLRIIGKAPQRLPRKPKKEKKVEPPIPTAIVENQPQEQEKPKQESAPQAEEAPAKEQKEVVEEIKIEDATLAETEQSATEPIAEESK